ncbi:MAG: glycosyl hydrolase [bacterium]|nr:glycosyl hydrolase [bacterium]
MQINHEISAQSLKPAIERMFDLSAEKIRRIESMWDPSNGTPVFTISGLYTTRGWTEWTQGFQYGSAILQFDATGDGEFLEIGRKNTLERMAPHVTHNGVHDHGFNNVSTYGNLLRLMNEGRFEDNAGERSFYEMALKCSGAVQAMRWSPTANGFGYVYSFNGPHSLFVDTIRTMRALGVAHRLGHVLMSENDKPVNLLSRLVQHARNTARYNVYYGAGRDAYDVRGRTVHEAVFNRNDGNFRCPSSQQGYSPFTTWTRGLAWAITGFAEELEFIESLDDAEFDDMGGKAAILEEFVEAAMATSDFYIENTPTDGVPYWDSGAPGLVRLGDYLNRASDPYNEHEPIDSSAAAIAAQGLIRLGNYFSSHGKHDQGNHYRQAGLTAAAAILNEPYISTDENHQGLILHSIYHRPNGWDYVPAGAKVPCGESSMWGDYHARELGVLLLRMADDKPYLTFYGAI